MKKKGFLIIIPVIAIIAVIFAFGVKKYNASFSSFKYDGYIIDNTSKTSSTSYYFAKDAKYKVKSTKNVVDFDSTDNIEVSVPDDSFLHFNDGSVSVFKKSVVLNLDDLSKNSLTFYNVYGGSIFTKIGTGYQISYLNSKLSFNNFLVKVSDNKYMLVANNITIKHGDKTEKVTDGYVEFVYLDGNIVRIENQNLEIQNISSDLAIEVGNVKLDMEHKKVYLDDVLKMNLGEITIDSDDNIEIVPDESNTDIDNPDLDGGHGIEDGKGNGSGSGSDSDDGSDGGSSSYTPNVNISGLKDGVIDTSIEKKEEVVIENVTVPDPEFSLENFKTTQTGFEAAVTVTVPDMNVEIPSNTNIIMQVIELSTNSVVFSKSVAGGTTALEAQADNILKPDTNYAFIVHATYIKNEIQYEKDFIQRTFVTDPIGITIEKAYAKSDGFGILVKKDVGSPVTAFSYIVLDENGNEINGVLEQSNTDIERGNVVVHCVDGSLFNSNTRYKFKITKIKNGNTYQENFDPIVLDIQTLKVEATFRQNSIVQVTNKQNSKFSFYLQNVNDPDNGIQEFRVDLYNANDNTLVASRSSNAVGTIDMLIDDYISRGVLYRADIVVLFNDNEKIIEQKVGETETFAMSGVEGPTVTFTLDENSTTFEHIVGSMGIVDVNNTLDPSSSIIVSYHATTINGRSIDESYPINELRKNGNTYIIPINYNNLAANTNYLFQVYARVNYKDSSTVNYVNACIGTFYVDTKPTNEMLATWRDETPGAHNFSVSFNLSQFKPSDSTELEANTLTSIRVRLFSADYQSTQDCVEANQCWDILIEDELKEEKYQSTLREAFYGLDSEGQRKYLNITEQDFLDAHALSSIEAFDYGAYYIEVHDAKDYTDYKNDIKIQNGVHPITISAGNEDPLKDIIVEPIYNEGSIVGLANNTIIGYKACPSLRVGTYEIEEYYYTLIHGEASYRIRANVGHYNNATNCVTLRFDELETADENAYNSLHYYRGGSFNIRIDMKTRNGSSISTSEPKTSPLIKPNKQVPSAYAYIKDRSSSDVSLSYRISDIDSALDAGDEENGIRAFYNTTGATTIDTGDMVAKCSGHNDGRNCISLNEEGYASGTLTINSSSGPFVLYVRAILNETTPDSYVMVPMNKGWSLASLKNGSYNIPTYYFSEKSANANYFEVILKNYEYDVKKMVMGYKLKFKGTSSSGTTYTTLYRDKTAATTYGTDGLSYKIRVSHNELSDLISESSANQTTITLELELLFDKDYYGFQSSNPGDGVAVQKQDQTYLTLDDSFYFDLVDFSFGDDNHLTLKAKDDNRNTSPIIYNTSKSNSGVVYSGNPIVLKQIYESESSCTTSGVNDPSASCTHWFSTSSPSFELLRNNVTESIGNIQLSPTILTGDNSTNILVYLYKEDSNGNFVNVKNNSCNGTDFTVSCAYLTMSLSDYRNAGLITISGLDKTIETYHVIFKFTNSKEPNPIDFSYGDDNVTLSYGTFVEGQNYPYYEVNTIDDPGLQILSAAYSTNPLHSTYDRAVLVKFKFATIDGFNGVRFEVYKGASKSMGGTKVNDLDLPYYTGLDLNTNEYYIDITPDYKGKSGDAGVTADNTFVIDGDYYYVEAIPYYCGDITSGSCDTKIDLVAGSHKSSRITNLNITKPVVTIKLDENSTPHNALFRVIISDPKFAFGGYAGGSNPVNSSEYTTGRNRREADATNARRYYYNAKIETSNGNITDLRFNSLLNVPKLSRYTSDQFNGVDCGNDGLCTMHIEYYIDTNNDGVYEKEEFTKQFVVDTGFAYISTNAQYLGNNYVRFYYYEAYNIDKVASLDYTVYVEQTNSEDGTTYDELYTNGSIDKDDFGFSSSGTTYYLNINIPLEANYYIIRLDYKNEFGVYTKSIEYPLLILN